MRWVAGVVVYKSAMVESLDEFGWVERVRPNLEVAPPFIDERRVVLVGGRHPFPVRYPVRCTWVFTSRRYTAPGSWNKFR